MMGPDFLWMDEEAWPKTLITPNDPKEIIDNKMNAVQAPADFQDILTMDKT